MSQSDTMWKIVYVLLKRGEFTCLRHEPYVSGACEKLALPGAVRYTLRKIDQGEIVAEMGEGDA